MPPWEIISAPTHLGLRPGGVERLGEVLLSLGLEARVGAEVVARVPARTSFQEERDPDTGLLNSAGLASHVRELGGEVAARIRAGGRPLVLGGDDSVLVGAAFGLRQLGRFGLLFLDAHLDFYPPIASPTGEASDSDLALATGFVPSTVGDLDHLAPYVRPEDVFAVGRRDPSTEAESVAFASSGIRSIELREIRERGATSCAREAAAALRSAGLAGVWIHLDCDVLDDRIMPAVDYRLDDGLTAPELVELLRTVQAEVGVAGMSVTIYNPNLDEGLSAGRRLVSVLGETLPEG